MQEAAASVYFVHGHPNFSDDANPGTEAEPFLTLTHAFSLARPGDIVVLLDWPLGNESLPLQIPAGITLRGHAGGQPFITGFGQYDGLDVSVVLHAGSVMENVHISGSPGALDHWAVRVAAGDAVIRNCRIGSHLGGGIHVEPIGASLGTVRIENNEIEGIQGPGMYFGGVLSACVVQHNRVVNNALGVLIGSDVTRPPDFGGGPDGSVGGNAFARSTLVDFSVEASDVLVFAGECYWDAVPPDTHVGAGLIPVGTDIHKLDSSTALNLSVSHTYVDITPGPN